MTRLRIGQGYDSHVLAEGLPLYIGGTTIDSQMGSKGHSDGDCLIHALIDALLGATAKGDIGQWFPDTDPSLKGVRSTELLQQILQSPRIPRFTLVNIDATIFLNRPKLRTFVDPIRDELSSLLHLNSTSINIKAKTWEGIEHLTPLIAASTTLLIELE